jgi:hypothetical protein
MDASGKAAAAVNASTRETRRARRRAANGRAVAIGASILASSASSGAAQASSFVDAALPGAGDTEGLASALQALTSLGGSGCG